MENQTGNTKNDVYAIVNQKIIEQLEKGTVPWLQPWTDAGLPKNAVSGKSYRGINIMLLGCMGYANNSFLTFKQLTDIGTLQRKNNPQLIQVNKKRIRKNKLCFGTTSCSM